MAEDRQRVRRFDGREARRQVRRRECVGPAEGADLVPPQWRGHRRATDRPDAVWAGGRLTAHVLQEIDVDPATAVLYDLDGDQLRRALARGLPELEDEVARLVEAVFPRDRDPDMDPARSCGLREA